MPANKYIGSKYPSLALTDHTRLNNLFSNTHRHTLRSMTVGVESNTMVVGVRFGEKSEYSGNYHYMAFHFLGKRDLSQTISLILDLEQRRWRAKG